MRDRATTGSVREARVLSVLRLWCDATRIGYVVGMSANFRLQTAAVSVMLALVGACGSSNDETLRSPVTTLAEPTTTLAESTTTWAESTTTLAEPTAVVVELQDPTSTTTTLPGGPIDFPIGPVAVAEVAGVAFDEMFVILALPGEDQPVAASLPPLTELSLTGRGWSFEEGPIWVEVTAGGVTGWISQWSLVYLGAPRDVTADAVTAFGQLPTAPTMLELGMIVMDELAPLDPDSAGAMIVRATEPGASPISEVVYDEFPGEKFGDDAAVGGRYRVTGRQLPVSDLPATGFASSLVYELVSVEVRSLCTRGVSSGFCL